MGFCVPVLFMVIELKSPAEQKACRPLDSLEMRRNGSAITRLKDGKELPFSNCLLQTPSNDLWCPSQHFIRCYSALSELHNTQISSCLWHQAPRVCGGHLDFIFAGVPGQQPCCETLPHRHRATGSHCSPGQPNGCGGHWELLKFSLWLGRKVSTAERFLAAGLLLWWGGLCVCVYMVLVFVL